MCWAIIANSVPGARAIPSSLWLGRPATDLAAKLALESGALNDSGVVLGAATLLKALEVAVSGAMYWQEPDHLDRFLSLPQSRELLLPAADRVTSSAAAIWWAEPMAAGAQYEVQFIDPRMPGPGALVNNPQDELRRWVSATIAEEREAAGRPADLNASFSGSWWSTPSPSRLHASTRYLEDRGPVGLRLVEDGDQWEYADCQQLLVGPETSVFEIASPDDWLRLVRQYPLPVARSRRHDWWRATGRDLPWVVPNYADVSQDYDAIHLSVLGYLSTAGRALGDGSAGTVLAGWDPDQTWWLTDRFELAVGSGHWRNTAPLGPESAWAPSD